MRSKFHCGTHGDLLHVDDLRERLLVEITEADHVTLDVTGLTSVDLSFVQLIESARLQAAIQGKTIGLSEPAPEPLARVVETSGLLWDSEPDDLLFWFHREAGQ